MSSAEQISDADIGADCIGKALMEFVEDLDVILLLLLPSLGRSFVPDGVILLVRMPSVTIAISIG